jgi:EAL domain-containing protein (putative c-di-GMP-specific phosphodiesterase class I)
VQQVKARSEPADDIEVTAFDRRWSVLRERTEDRTIDATHANPVLTGAWLAAAVGVAWMLSYHAGGSRTALPHLFYVPVVVAAARFSFRGALVTSVASGLVAGPLLPLNTAEGLSQEPGNWLARLVAFVVIGQITAYLCQHSRASMLDALSHRRFRRDLQAAIERGQLRLVYQPIVALSSGELVGVEALARWNHPSLGAVPPDQFIRDAEQAGCVSTITRWVLQQASADVAQWRAATFLPESAEFRVAINVSAGDVLDPAFHELVADVLHAGLPNSWLCLELTETAVVSDVRAVINELMALRMLGIRLAIDDFGTGESSLAYLQQFPIDILKIDRMFVATLDHGFRGDVVARGVTAMATAMNMTTVAEGIETPAQALHMRDLGCQLAQGYLFSPPVEASELQDLLVSRAWFRDRNLSRLEPPQSSDRHA